VSVTLEKIGAMHMIWKHSFEELYAFGNDLGLLDSDSYKDYYNTINTKDIEIKAEKARKLLPQTVAFYLNNGASDIFIEQFKDYIQNGELRSLGDTLIDFAINHGKGFSSDWKTHFKESYKEMQKIVPELPDDIIQNLAVSNMLNLIAYVNSNAKKNLHDTMFVQVATFSDSDMVLLVKEKALVKHIDNPFMLFEFSPTYQNIHKTQLDLTDPYWRVKKLIKATNLIIDYEGFTDSENLFIILVLLENAIGRTRGLVFPENEKVIKQRMLINQAYNEIRNKVGKLSRNFSRKERQELIDSLGKEITNSWKE
jgi:hypothetical protein